MNIPVIDLHCDLLSYLTLPNSDINNTEDIGVALPYLKAGQVKLQVMAIFAATEINSHNFGLKQSEIFRDLDKDSSDFYKFKKADLKNFGANEKVGMLASLESASAFCNEVITLKEGFQNLEKIITNVGDLFYISLTHHSENRFGGGNYATAGLKEDGKSLLDYINGKKISVDLSHTSDALAYGILEYIAKNNLEIPIMASHSNYRAVYDHRRNLPDDIAQEIITQKGLIGLNFLRDFVNPDKVDALGDHLEYGLKIGARDAVAYGADYFYTNGMADRSRIPFYNKAIENASCYPNLNTEFSEKLGNEIVKQLSYENALNYIKRVWN